MEKYKYRLKDSAKKDMMIINGTRLEKGKDYHSSKKLDFGKFNGLINTNINEKYEKFLIQEEKKKIKEKEKKIIKILDLTKASKKSLVEYILQNTDNPILNDRNLLESLKKSDLIDILNMLED